jgi:hypothetical protein
MKIRMIVQHMRAKNDVNGNPRRVYVVYGRLDSNDTERRYLDIVDVYDGRNGEPKEIQHIAKIPEAEITPKDYRQYIELRRDLKRMEASKQ